ncbi:MAG: anthranilate synthase component I family protein [Actinobacteria bacterium]|nr:anthranilate synthase component I family protein [Actinomycetota bacterium]
MTTTATIPMDLITPLGAYLRVRGLGASILLESVEKGRLGRFSFVGWGSRLAAIDEVEALVAGGAAAVGYVGYDHAAGLEPVPLPPVGPRFPESRFVVPDGLLRLDHATGLADVLVGDPDEMRARLEGPLPEDRVAHLGPAPSPGREDPPAAPEPFRRAPSRQRYEDSVRRAREHIEAGDCFQVVLSQRAERRTAAGAVDVYRRLRRINPSPYLFLLELGELAVLGSSPETLVRVEGGRALLNPIAGTTPRGPGDAERLLASEKDRAEHVMLVDLGRNDLSRVCRAGTVRVERLLEPERYSHVTHLVSEVAGEVRPGIGPFDVLRACFPAGTVTGAPKVRAMQLISEIEGYRRGIYAGAVGYALPDGTLDTCIAIRMVVLAGGVAHLQAGAGIVADSVPEAEHRECRAKLAALEAAITQAEVT